MRVGHDSWYRYDVPVRLAAHVLRLTPRPADVQVRSRELHVEPAPILQRDEVDAQGNVITHLAFAGSTRSLRVISAFEVDTRFKPALETLELAPLAEGAGRWVHPEVFALASRIAQEVGYARLAFLDQLSRHLSENLQRYVRHTGDARPAHETLAVGGACRDLTVLFLEACAAYGIEGRFVSGYQAWAHTPEAVRSLHAWAEVLLPGVGYHGWDPMHGVRALDAYVALCAAPTQAETMPIEGGFAFDGATVNATLDHVVRIATEG